MLQKKTEMTRPQSTQARPEQSQSAQPAPSPRSDHRQRIVKILVPRGNVRDVLSAELVLSTLSDQAPFGLEIIGTAATRAFQVRGEADAVKRVLAQIRFAYPQCEFEEVTAEQDTMNQRYVARRVIELRLREGAYLPIRTNVTRQGRVTNDDQAQGADPMIGLLAAMDDLEAGESVLVQCALRAMPPDWSKYWRGSQTDIEARTKFSPKSLGGTLALAFGLMLCSIAMALVALSLFAKSVLLWPWVIGLLALGSALVYLRFRLPSPPDPALVKQKIVESAFRVRVRVFVTAGSGERADQRIEQMWSAFQAYNLAGGNGFLSVVCELDVSPHDMQIGPDTGLSRLPVLGLLRSPSAELPILSTSEVAMLWHLPHGMAGLQGMDTPNSKALLPIDADVAEGILIGQSKYQNQVKAVRLSKAMLRGHVGLVAQTQTGKSNLMALAVAQIMEAEPEASVIVLDPHRRLAQTLAGLVPKSRVAQTVFLSLADRDYPFGLNLLDRLPKTQVGAAGGEAQFAERYTDKLVSDVIGSLNEIWPDNWGPRMESFLRWSLLTLGYANEVLVADHQFLAWHRQACEHGGRMRDRIAGNTLTKHDIGIILGDLQAFAHLKSPPLGSIAREYESLSRLYQALGAGMRDAANRVKSPEALARLKTLRDLQERLDTFAKSGYKRSGISQRVYGHPLKPLQYSLLDVTPLLLHGDFRQRILGAVTGAGHRHVDRWWKDSFNVYRDTNHRLLLEMIQPVISKMDRFNASTEARRIFGQPESTIDIPAIINSSGILIVDLAAGVVGQDTAALIGSTLMNWIAATLFGEQRSESGPQIKTRSPIYIIIDEFQSLPGIDYAFMLSELGKYGARLMMGTQSLKFLDAVNEKARASWLDNTGTLFVFRCGADDAEHLAKELAISDDNPLSISPGDIVGLSDFTCYVRVRNGQGKRRVFQCVTQRAPDSVQATWTEVRRLSRDTYCRPASQVDEWLGLAQDDQGNVDMTQSSSGGHHSANARMMGAMTMPDVMTSAEGAVPNGQATDSNRFDLPNAVFGKGQVKRQVQDGRGGVVSSSAMDVDEQSLTDASASEGEDITLSPEV